LKVKTARKCGRRSEDSGRHNRRPRTANNHHHQHQQLSSSQRVPTRFSTQVYLGEPGSLTHTVPVDHRDVCGRWHLHRLRSLAPAVRRALCGHGSYRVVPVLAEIPYDAPVALEGAA
jgi:hypothetical protein